MSFIDDVYKKVKGKHKKIVLPEGEDDRILKATHEIIKKEIADIIIIGNKENILERSKNLNLDLAKAEIIDPLNSDLLEKFANSYFESRKNKGLTKENALEEMKHPIFFGAALVKEGMADGSLAGSINPTATTVRAGLRLVGMEEGLKTLSSFFIMIMPDKSFGEDGIVFFADCAVLPVPNKDQLADIAISTAKNFKAFIGKEPKVAMLSFSTKGSAQHEVLDKVKDAVKIVNEKMPELNIDGEMQADAALIESIGSQKAPNSKVAGKANVLIFPDLNSGNISYKLTQRIGKAQAVGPVFQGLKKPLNDLSRGCSVEDIVKVTALTAIQAL